MFLGVGSSWGPSGAPDDDPPVVVAPPAVSIEPSVPGAVPPPPPSWYSCDNPQGYYPSVHECPGGWRPVAPTPPEGDPTNKLRSRGNASAQKPATTSSRPPASGGRASTASIARLSTAETTPTPAPPGHALVERATAECALWRGSAREQPCMEHRIQALTHIEAMRSHLHFVQAQQDCAYTRDSLVLAMCPRLKLQEVNRGRR